MKTRAGLERRMMDKIDEVIELLDQPVFCLEGYFNSRDKRFLAEKICQLFSQTVSNTEYKERIDRIFEEIEKVSQTLDENGEGTDDPGKVIETIYYIGKGRLDALKKKEKQ